MKRFKSLNEWRESPPDDYWGDDVEPEREIDWIDDNRQKNRIKFTEVIDSDYREVAAIKGKDRIVYAIYFETAIEAYRPYRTYGDEYDSRKEYDDIDDSAIIALASDTEDESYGVGEKDWQSGNYSIVAIDDGVIKDLVDTFKLNKDKIRSAIEPQKQKFAKTFQASKKFNI